MKKFALAVLTAVIALLAVAGFAPTAQAYPELRFDLTVDRSTLPGGETFTATATSNVTCDWVLEWNGVNRTRNGSSAPFSTTYTAPEVTKVTKIPLHGTCTYDEAAAGRISTSARVAAATETWDRTIMITVLPAGDDTEPPGDNLPNTGGPKFWLLLAGLGLAIAGGLTIRASKQRA